MNDLANRGLRAFTPARVGLARTGNSVATREQLEFQLDHALARDAVHARLDVTGLLAGLTGLGLEALALRSAVEPAPDERKTYLLRPDLGRQLSQPSTQLLRNAEQHPADVIFVIADGLSALAIERHALHLIAATLPLLRSAALAVGPACIVSQGRVAVGDPIGELLSAKAVVMLIGERPGLSTADSLGAYVTWAPRIGRTDAERNCISNIRTAGLGYADAAQQIAALLAGARSLGASGVDLRLNPGRATPELRG
jgi:ethanolamine ammonia-lyase small subunit